MMIMKNDTKKRLTNQVANELVKFCDVSLIKRGTVIKLCKWQIGVTITPYANCWRLSFGRISTQKYKSISREVEVTFLESEFDSHLINNVWRLMSWHYDIREKLLLPAPAWPEVDWHRGYPFYAWSRVAYDQCRLGRAV